MAIYHRFEVHMTKLLYLSLEDPNILSLDSLFSDI